jgi:ribosome-associated toxin RatA of RatAB toxin-antitoxin module
MGIFARFRGGFAVLAGLGLMMTGRHVGAQAAPPSSTPSAASAPEATRLLASHAAERYDVAVPGQKLRAGAAMVAIDAPFAVVRRLITDFAHYQDVLPGFQKSRVLGQSAAGTDVYLQVPILHGAATLWAVTRFTAPVREGNGERIDGKRNGPANLDDLRATWHIYPVDDDHTVLKLELLLVPRLPLPDSFITSQLAESADDAVRACRDRAEALVSADGPPQAARPPR